LGVLFYFGIFWPNTPSITQYPVRGIDVSHHQGDINWFKVSQQNYKFAYIKATEGDDFVDKSFTVNWQQAKDNGLIVGAYHFYSLRFTAISQAKNFIQTVPKELSLPPVVDLEFGGNSQVRPTIDEFQNELNIFLSTIAKHYNQKPLIYTTYEFYKHYLGSKYNDYQLWIRDIFFYPKSLNWTFWQYKNRGRVSGIKGYVDLNVFNGSLDSFSRLLVKP
jgi:lysozyme